MSARTPLFVLAVVCGVLLVGIELAALGLRPAVTGTGAPPGMGIPYLALVDGLFVFLIGLQGTSLVLSQRVTARVQGVVTLVVSLLLVLASLVLAFVALTLLLLMVGLLVAIPFGTIVYLALWGSFPVGTAAALLGLVLVLKLAMGGLLLGANPRFLTNKGLVSLYAVSVVLQLVLAFLHGLLPGVVVSIGDDLWAVVVAVVALVWAVLTLVGSVPAVLRALRSVAPSS